MSIMPQDPESNKTRPPEQPCCDYRDHFGDNSACPCPEHWVSRWHPFGVRVVDEETWTLVHFKQAAALNCLAEQLRDEGMERAAALLENEADFYSRWAKNPSVIPATD